MAAESSMFKNFYEDFEPYCKWTRVQEHDTLEVHLQGFKKDQLKIQVNNQRIMTVTGERRVDGSKIIRFRKEIKVSKHYKTEEIRARITGGILYIIMPKQTTKLPKSLQNHNNKKDEQVNPKRLPENVAGRETSTDKSSRRGSGLVGGFATAVAPMRPNIEAKLKYFSKLKMKKEMAATVIAAVAFGVAVGAFLLYKRH